MPCVVQRDDDLVVPSSTSSCPSGVRIERVLPSPVRTLVVDADPFRQEMLIGIRDEAGYWVRQAASRADPPSDQPPPPLLRPATPHPAGAARACLPGPEWASGRALPGHAPPLASPAAAAGRWRSRRVPAATPRPAAHRRVADLVAAGHTNREIAAILCCSHHTVRHLLEHIMAKLGVRRRAEIRDRLGSPAQPR